MSINRYLDPKNDIAFKKIFGEEENKDILISFINDILGLTGEETVKDVKFSRPHNNLIYQHINRV